MKFHCKHCGKTVTRLSDKAWIRSYCIAVERPVRLMAVKTPKKRTQAA